MRPSLMRLEFEQMKRIAANAEVTREVAAEFAPDLKAGSVVALVGDLGAGKTEFVKGLAAGLGSPAVVTSPTFTLIHEYLGGWLPLFQMDFIGLSSNINLNKIGLTAYWVRAAFAPLNGPTSFLSESQARRFG